MNGRRGRGRRRARKQKGWALSVVRGTIRKGVRYRDIIGAYATHACYGSVMLCCLHLDQGHSHSSHSRVVPVLDVRQVEDRVLDGDGAQRGADLGVGYGMCVMRGRE